MNISENDVKRAFLKAEINKKFFKNIKFYDNLFYYLLDMEKN